MPLPDVPTADEASLALFDPTGFASRSTNRSGDVDGVFAAEGLFVPAAVLPPAPAPAGEVAVVPEAGGLPVEGLPVEGVVLPAVPTEPVIVSARARHPATVMFPCALAPLSAPGC